MTIGISVYPGLDSRKSLEESVALAIKENLKYLFLSLHIPEADQTTFSEDLEYVLSLSRKNHINVIADMTPETKKLFGKKVSCFHKAGISILRLDDGFLPHEVADLSYDSDLALNASTLSYNDLDALCSAGCDFSRITGLHNFYPRPYTGLGPRDLYHKNELFHHYRITTGAFVAAANHGRGPLHCGLPTLETTRNTDIYKATRLLRLLGTDEVFIGDSRATQKDIQDLKSGAYESTDCIRLPIVPQGDKSLVEKIVNIPFLSRPDRACNVIRVNRMRTNVFKDISVPINADTTVRRRGDITVDTGAYGRYNGEIQVITTDLPADSKTRLVARIKEEDTWLLDGITENQSFMLVCKDMGS